MTTLGDCPFTVHIANGSGPGHSAAAHDMAVLLPTVVLNTP